MKTTFKTLLVMMCLVTPSLGHAQNGATNVQIETTRTGLSVDLTALEKGLNDDISGWSVSNSCGDQIALGDVTLSDSGTTATASVSLRFWRVQCVSQTEPVCKGFTCTTQTRTVRTVTYRTSAPINITISAPINQGTPFAMTATANENPSIAKQFLGNDRYYIDFANRLTTATQNRLNSIVPQIRTTWRQSPHKGTPLNKTSRLFLKSPNGSVSFLLTLP